MSSAVSATPNPVNASQHANNTTSPAIANGTTSSSSGAVPAQLPVRSYANATKTATPTNPTGASAPAHNAKPVSDNTQMNGTAAQGGSQQPANGMNGHASDHSRKTSVVISASGASGSYPNGGPVQNGNSRPAINFGSMGAPGAESQGSAPFVPNNASLETPTTNPRVTSPAHSPSPIPQPAASGGRPPSINSTNNGGLNFGAMSTDTEMMRGQGNMGPVPIHERRPSSHSMQSELSNQGVNMSRPGFPPHSGSSRGRGAFNPQQSQQQFGNSPSAGYRQMQGQQQRGPMPPQFGQQGGPPGSPFRGSARMSPAPNHVQPHYQPQHMAANPQMQYGGYPQHMNQQQQAMYGMPNFDPTQGFYNPYYPQNYYGQQPPQSPRPPYPTPFNMPPNANQPPFHPSGTPGAASMNRSASQASERPPSSIGHPQTPSQTTPAPSHTPNVSQGAGSAFQRPKKSSAIKITDASGNAIDFKKTAPSPNPQTQAGGPVIVSTPSNPTPPPRVPSTQHNRTESKSQQDPEKTKNEFVERVKRQAEENKRKEAKSEKDASDVKAKERADQEEAAQNEIKKATAEAEEAAAKAASDKKAVDDAAAAKKAAEDEASENTRKQEEEDERLEREIAEMEAKEKEEEERERAYSEKKAKQKAEQAAKEAERAKQADEDLKRQEREAEAREEAREREREGGAAADTDDEEQNKALFATLNKHPELGSAPASGAETPASDDTSAEAESSATAPARAGGAQKPKPAHLKIETNKQVERPEPTPGMQALKSARFLELEEDAKYPDGFRSPNPALNQSRQKGKAYDKDFLLQFQGVFKEKPSVDWDQKVKETLGPGDEPGSARPGSARTPSSTMSRGGSNRPGAGGAFGAMGGAMGNFAGPMGGNARGTTSEQRFAMSNQVGGPPRPGGTMAPPMGGRQPSNLGMGAPGAMMSRTNSSLNMAGGIGPGSPRNPSARGGKGGSKRDNPSRRQESDMAAKMPLTANKELAPLEKSSSGWKPTSIGQPAAAGPDPSGNMAPDMVQRKVKAALNKMTPEKFDKIADQILAIAAQSKTEQDGRTLRQVIQLTFEKACDEAHWAGMYAKFCHKMLTTMSTDIRDETIKDKNGNPVVGGALFRKYLLNRCQEEFEHGWQANLPDKPEGEEEAALLTDDYYIAAAAKRRGLGLIQFIGQLYKLRMLTLRIMHECVMRLLNFEGDPDEATVENLTTLLKAVGASMEEEDQGRGLMVTYFQRIKDSIVKSDALGSRPKFMIMDLIDLRKTGWKSKDSDKGPKTIQQIHEEAEAAQAKAELERQKTQRGGRGGPMPSGRGDARNFSGGMPPPQDYSRTNVNMDDLRRLQNRGSNPRPAGASLGPGGGLGPSALGSGRTGSRRGAAGLGPGSAGTSRTNTPPVDKKDEPSTAQNAFSALAALDSSGEQPEGAPEASGDAARTQPAAQDADANA